MAIRKPARKKEAESFTISFRVGQSYQKMLERGAEELGLSVHAYARSLLLEVLEDAERGVLLESVTELRGELERHRQEFRHAVLALLVFAGEQEEQDAEAWLRENLALE